MMILLQVSNLAHNCWRKHVMLEESGVSAMNRFVPRFSARVRTFLGLVSESVRKVLGNTRNEDFRSQRMCPFCGLITSRRKPCCLECGKWLKPA
jgi:hypothetical protein